MTKGWARIIAGTVVTTVAAWLYNMVWLLSNTTGPADTPPLNLLFMVAPFIICFGLLFLFAYREITDWLTDE